MTWATNRAASGGSSSPGVDDARLERALEFVLRQGDNGIVWNILSYWRETG